MLFCFVVANVVADVVDDDDVVVFVVGLSQKPSIKSMVKIGSVIEILLLLFFLLLMLLLFMLLLLLWLLLIPQTYI